MKLRVCTVLSVGILLSGGPLGWAATPPAPTPQTPSAAESAASEESPAPDAKPVPLELPAVVARVNDEDVGQEEFERAVKDIEARGGGPVPPDMRDTVYRQVLERLVSYRLLAQESQVRQIAVTDAEVQQRLAQIRLQYLTEEAFQQALTERATTFEALRDETQVDLRIAKMVDAELAGLLAIGEKSIEDFYIQNPQDFREAEAVRASHILIRVAPEADEQTRQQQRTVCEVLLRRLKAGEDFATLASQHSHDVSGKNGGDLGFISKGDLVPAVEEAAFALAPDELSDVVESPFGFHIIKGGVRRAARSVPFDEVSVKIRGFLEEQARQRETEAFIERLKAKANIEILI